MKHTRSSAEWEIRDAVVAWIREELPRARVVHELVVGSCRADVAAVTPDKVYLWEIKSERDTLDRLKAQLKTFDACAHHTILVAHRKWFDTKPYNNGAPRLAWDEELSGGWLRDVWCYPRPEESTHRWNFTNDMIAGMRQPHAVRLLGLLWKAELVDLARRHMVRVNDRLAMGAIIDVLVWHLDGRQICEGVCAALRRREFAEADEPIGGVS
ncbi:hypothetical protein GCM10007913_11390 [Devosia yakushimensis]|uniref:NERD domain-containing protein n=1 Tax=Devosia yakushimensis TaxID=470028 RepID=A0ABQ5UCY5_9HYPH|nr:hypothetical protein [Devosia yakushimensis]GLQ09207.1 hypothetical protein GCM10007913_11390 [Devosia yakushimensis]